MRESILLVRLGAIGDVVNALVLANAIKRAWPGCFIGWAVHPRSRPIVEGHVAVDAVHPVPRGARLPGALGELRRRGYETAIDLQRLFKSGLVSWLSGAPRRLGFDFNRSRELSWLFSNDRLPPHDPQRHVVDQYLEFARHLGIEAPAVEWRLESRPREREWAAGTLPQGRRWAVLSLGAGKPANRWSAAGWAELAEALALKRETGVCLVGGPEELLAARAVRGLLPANVPVTDLVGQTTIEQLVALLERADVVVTCDSGPMHLAVALGRRVVALFGPANPMRTGPYGQPDHVIDRRELWCSPCLRRTPCGHYECMPGIPARRVLAKLDELR